MPAVPGVGRGFLAWGGAQRRWSGRLAFMMFWMPGVREYRVTVAVTPKGRVVVVRAAGGRGWGKRDWAVVMVTALICVGAMWLGWEFAARMAARGGLTNVWGIWMTRIAMMLFLGIPAWGYVLMAMRDVFTSRVTVAVNGERVEGQERWGLRRNRWECASDHVRRLVVALPRTMARRLMEGPVEKRPLRVALELQGGECVDVVERHTREVALELAQALAGAIGEAQRGGGRALDVVDFSDVVSVRMEDAIGGEGGGWVRRETGEGIEMFKPRGEGWVRGVIGSPFLRFFLWPILLPGPLMAGAAWLAPETAEVIWRVFPAVTAIYGIGGVLGIFIMAGAACSRHVLIVSQEELIDRHHVLFCRWTRKWRQERVASVYAEQKVVDQGQVSSRVMMMLTDGERVMLWGGDVVNVVRLAGLMREALGVPAKASASVPVSHLEPAWHDVDVLERPENSRWTVREADGDLVIEMAAKGCGAWFWWSSLFCVLLLVLGVGLLVAAGRVPADEFEPVLGFGCVFTLSSLVLLAMGYADARETQRWRVGKHELEFESGMFVRRTVRLELVKIRAAWSEAQHPGNPTMGAQVMVRMEDGKTVRMTTCRAEDARWLATLLRANAGVGRGEGEVVGDVFRNGV
jgi:hypothetical protein